MKLQQRLEHHLALVFLLALLQLASSAFYTGSAQVSLALDPPAAGRPATLTFTIKPTDPITSGDSLRFLLSRFQKCGYDCTEQVQVEQNDYTSDVATWFEGNYTLVFTFINTLASSSSLSLKVSSTQNIKIPNGGLTQNDPLVQYCVEQSCPCSVPAIGSFYSPFPNQPLQLVLTHRYDIGSPLNAKLSFFNAMPLQLSDIITVSLPYFYGSSSQGTPVAGIPFSISWNNETFELSMTYTSSQPYTSEYHVLNNLFDTLEIFAPSIGVENSFPVLTIQSDAAQGPVPPTAIQTSFLPGKVKTSNVSFCNCSCVFDGFEWMCHRDTPAPGASAEIEFVMEFNVNLSYGQTISMVMSNISANDQSNIPLSLHSIKTFAPGSKSVFWLERNPYGCLTQAQCSSLEYASGSIFSQASWSNKTSTLEFTMNADIPMNTLIRAVIPQSAGFQIPKDGIPASYHDVFMKSSGSKSSIEFAPFKHIEAVSLFDFFSVSFDPPRPFQQADVYITFSKSTDIFPGDILALFLPGFHFNISEFNVSAGSQSFWRGNWSHKDEILYLASANLLSAGELQSVSLQRLGIVLPLAGVPALEIKSWMISQLFPVAITPVVNTQRVPAALSDTNLTFNKKDAIGFSTLSFQFTINVIMSSQDVIRLNLVDFSGVEVLHKAVTIYSDDLKHSARANASWLPRQYLELIVLDALPVNSSWRVDLDEGFHISLPLFKISSPNVDVFLQSYGNLTHRPFDFISPISPLLSASFHYISVQAGQVSAFRLTLLTLDFVLKRGDEVIITLNGFSKVGDGLLNQSSLIGQYFEAAFFNASSSRLVLTVNQTLSMYFVEFLHDVGIAFPPGGIEIDSRLVSIELNTTNYGIIHKYFIPNLPPLGAFYQPVNLSFSNPIASQFTSFQLNVSYFRMLQTGDALILSLSEFGHKTSSAFNVISRPPGVFSYCSFVNQTFSISCVVTSQHKIPPFQQFSITAVDSVLQLPTHGVLLPSSTCVNTSQACPMAIAVSAQRGSVYANPRYFIRNYRPIGTFRFSSVSFDPETPGNVTEIQLTFTLSFDMKEKDRMTMLMPYLVARDAKGSFDLGNTSGFQQGQWTRETGGILFSFESTLAVPSGKQQTLLVPRMSGFSIPPQGISYGLKAETLLAYAGEQGNIVSTPVAFIVLKGKFESVQLIVSPMIAGSDVHVQVSFRPSMTISAGSYVRLRFHQFLVTAGAMSTQVGMTVNPDLPAPQNLMERGSFASGELTVSITREIASRSLVLVDVPPSMNLSVPFAGISNATPALFLSTDTVQGPVDGQAVYVNVYPFFMQNAITLNYASPVTVNIQLQARNKINKGSTLDLYLNSFLKRSCSPTGCPIQLDVKRIAYASASTSSVGSCQCQNLAYPAAGRQFLFFGSTCLAWNLYLQNPCNQPHCCSNFCFVKPTCPTATPWDYNNNVYVSYENCANNQSQYCPVTYQVTSREGGTWYPELQRLSFKISEDVLAYSPLVLSIASDQGFYTRQEGIPGSDPFLMFQDGIIAGKLPLMFQNRTGAFENSSMTSSKDLSAGETSEFSLKFIANIDILSGEHVFAYLPGFSSPRQTIPFAFLCNSSSSAFSRGVWYPSNFTLVFPVANNITRNSSIIIVIPKDVVFVPLHGYNASRPLRLFTDASVWPTSPETGDQIEFPSIGALWNTMVTFHPPLVDERLQLNFSFTPMVSPRLGDRVFLYLSGFAGPSQEEQVRVLQQVPANSFRVGWQRVSASQAALVLVFIRDDLAAGTDCFISLPSSCTFVLADGSCRNDSAISLPSKALTSYSPAALQFAGSFINGRVLATSVAMSSAISAAPAMNALAGHWEGTTFLSAGVYSANRLLQSMSCLSQGLQCPSSSSYSCDVWSLPTSLDVERASARLQVTPTTRTPLGFTHTFFSGSFTSDLLLLQYDMYHLVMTNMTEKNQTNFMQAVNSSNLCAYARPMYLVDTNMSYQLAMELVLDFTFETLRFDRLYLICRVNVSGSSQFNPLGLQLADPNRLLALQLALATLAQVSPINVVFASSANFSNGSTCSDSLSCLLQFYVFAEHEWQQLDLRLWVSKFQAAVESQQLTQETLKGHVNVSLSLAEPFSWSPRLVPSPSCPPPPQYRASRRLSWALGGGMPVGAAASGFATASSASCTSKRGAQDGQAILYSPSSSSLGFRLVGVMTRRGAGKLTVTVDTVAATPGGAARIPWFSETMIAGAAALVMFHIYFL